MVLLIQAEGKVKTPAKKMKELYFLQLRKAIIMMGNNCALLKFCI